MSVKSPKIVFTVTSDLTYDQRMDRICSTLSMGGYEVHLVGREKKDSKPLSNKNYTQHRFKLFFEKGKMFYVEYNIRLFFYLLFIKTDIISSVDLDTIFPAWLVSKIRRKKFVYDSHEYFTEVIELVKRPAIKKIWERVEQFVLKRTEYAYTVSESLKNEFEKKYPAKFEVIRNVPFKESLEEVGKKEKVLIYVGVVNAGRGLEELIDAIKESEYVLWICGKGDIYEDLVKKLDTLGLQNRVKFWGYLEPSHLREVIRRAYAGYLLLEKESLSYYYSLANKFFDYMHAGIPQLVIDFPEYKLINQKYEVALLTELNKQSILNNLNRLWNDQELYNKLKQNTYQAREEYCWERESLKLLEFYHKVQKGN